MNWLAFLIAIISIIALWAAPRNRIEWWATLITVAWVIQLVFTNLDKIAIG